MSKTIEIPDYSIINENIAEQVDSLFSFAHPTRFKNHLTTVLMKYLRWEYEALPPNFEDMIESLHVLIDFLVATEREIPMSRFPEEEND
ncbi:MAG: hypothetical protein AAGA66_03220 [Bacteroidota bacterium]